MQVPRPQNRPVTPNSAPNVRVGGGSVTGENFGSAYWRDIQSAAKGVGDVGNALLFEEQKKQQKADQAAAVDAFNAGIKRSSDEMESVLSQYRGGKAGEAPEAVGEMMRTIHEDISKNLKNQHQKEAFDRDWARHEMQTAVRTNGWRDRQIEEHRILGLDKRIELETSNGAEAILDPDGMGAFGDALTRINGAIDELTKDMPPEAAEVYRRNTLEKFHTNAVTSLATQGADKALNYLDSEMAKKALPAAKIAALREKYKEADDLSIDTKWAMNLAEMNVPDEEIFRRAYTEHAKDPRRAASVVQIAEAYKSRMASQQKALAADTTRQAWSAFAETNYDITKIPDSLRIDNPKLYKEMLEYHQYMAKIGDEKLDPDLDWIDQMRQMSPDEYNEWVAQPGNYKTLMLKTAGKHELVNDIEKHIKAKTSSGGGSSGGSGSTSVNPDDWFENAYGTMYQEGWYWVGPAEYDPKSAEAKRQGNGFRIRYRDRLAQKETDLGRKANPQEQKEVAMGLIRDVRDGFVKLESSYYEEGQDIAAPASERTVNKQDLTPEQAALAGDDPVVSIMGADGQNSTRFARPPTGSIKIPDDVKLMQPDEVLQALDRGEMGGVAFEKGDIVVKKNNSYYVFGSDNQPKGGFIPGQVAASADSAPVVHPEPGKSTAMRKLESEGARFTWRGERQIWTGFYSDGRAVIVDRNGSIRPGSVKMLGPQANMTEGDAIRENLREEGARLADLETRLIGVKQSGGMKNLKTIQLRQAIEQQRAKVEALQAEYRQKYGGE